MPPPARDETPAARRYVTAFLATFLALSGGLAALSVALDPTGYFGTGLVPPSEQTSRDDKARLYAELADKPAALILGSSRVWCLAPAKLQAITGLSGFNFGVDTATSDDLLAILRFATQGRPRGALKLVVLGVEPEMFGAQRDRSSRLDYARRLRPFAAPGAVQPLWRMSGDLLLGETTIEGDRRALRRRFLEPAQPPRYAFAPTGEASWPRQDDERRRGVYHLKESAAQSLAYTEALAARFTELSPARVASFHAFLELASTLDVEVVAFVPPLLDSAWPTIDATPLGARYRALDRLLQQLANEGALHLAAPGRIAVGDFGGDPEQFNDHQHMTIANGDRMLDHVLRRALVRN